jgi:hypothetical protein
MEKIAREVLLLRTKEFWTDTFERAAKTAAQTLSGSLVVFTGLLDVDWVNSLSAAGLATLLSVLTSIGSSKKGDKESASLVDTVKE